MSSVNYQLNAWTSHLLEQVAHYFSRNQQQAYLVGGSVRNLLLGEPCIDWDIVTTGDALKLARPLANQLGGFYAHLHDTVSRIVVKHDGQEMTLDVAPLNGPSIEADLRQRDFTMNAIAASLADVVRHMQIGESLALIDPLQGASNLEVRRLKAVADDVFQRDPLRILRAVRFRMRYSLTIVPETLEMLRRDAPLLMQVAPERIHDEVYAILQPSGATERLRFLDTHGLFSVLMPEFLPARGMPQPGLHHWDVLEHSLEAVGALEQLAAMLQQPQEEIRFKEEKGEMKSAAINRSGRDKSGPYQVANGEGDLVAIEGLLSEAQEQGIFQFKALTSPAMKLAALLHDVGKTVTYSVDEKGAIHFYGHPQAGVPLARQVMQRLSASTQDRRLVQQVVAHHMRPGLLSNDNVTPRAIRRYFVDLGPTGIYVALVSLADHLAMSGPDPLSERWVRHLATVRLLLTSYIRERERIMPPRLIAPEELIRRFKLESGPIIGQLLDQLSEAQAEGVVQSKEEAIWFVEEKVARIAKEEP